MDEPALFRQFNLSRIKSLRTIETTAESITTAKDAAASSLSAILSTVTSPMLLDLVIVYWDSDVEGVNRHRQISGIKSEPEYRAACALRHQHWFKVFREVHEARDFQLVLCADVLDPMVKYATGMLDRLVGVEKMWGGLDYLAREPLVIVERRSPRARGIDSRPGWGGRRPVCASAL